MATIPGGSFYTDDADHQTIHGSDNGDTFMLSHNFDNITAGSGDDFFNLSGSHDTVMASTGGRCHYVLRTP